MQQQFLRNYLNDSTFHHLKDAAMKNLPFSESILDHVRLRVISAVRYWLESFYTFDFRGNNDQLHRLDEFVLMIDNSPALAKMLKRTIEKVVEDVIEKITHDKAPLKCPPIRTLLKNPLVKKTYFVLQYHRKEIARQLSH
jgi:hypothetical protein